MAYRMANPYVGGITPIGAPTPRVYARPLAPPAIGGGVSRKARRSMEEAIEQYRPGGGYGAGVEAALERGRTKAVSGGMQALVSAGLAGTTMPAGLTKKYEEEIGMPARAQVEETRAQAISGLQMLKAQITQGATEATRTRALQEYLAKLQAQTSLQATGMQTGTQAGIAAGQLGLGYAQLGTARQTALAQIASREKLAPREDTGTYGSAGAGYGGYGEAGGTMYDYPENGYGIGPGGPGTYQDMGEKYSPWKEAVRRAGEWLD